MQTNWHPEQGVTSNPAEVDTMASVLEARHGALASEIAEFFAALHGHKGDAPRSWAWNIVAETIRRREQSRQADH
jgi:hypothetical protein